jgi:prephenate dehydrogenase
MTGSISSASAVVFGGGSGWGKRVFYTLQHLAGNTQIIEKDASRQQIDDEIENSEIVFLAIPDDQINGLLIGIEHLLTQDKIIIDCATNKSEFGETLRQIAESGPSVCSTHPLVSPKSSPTGHNVLIMPLGNNSESDPAYGNDSPLYGAMGFVRKSEKKSGLTRKKKNGTP